jgi:hypothetical protein
MNLIYLPFSPEGKITDLHLVGQKDTVTHTGPSLEGEVRLYVNGVGTEGRNTWEQLRLQQKQMLIVLPPRNYINR